MTVLFAQSLVEYGIMNTIVSNVSLVASRLEGWVMQQSPSVLLLVGAVILIWIVSRAFRPGSLK
jgi:hypothetical protein